MRRKPRPANRTPWPRGPEEVSTFLMEAFGPQDAYMYATGILADVQADPSRTLPVRLYVQAIVNRLQAVA